MSHLSQHDLRRFSSALLHLHAARSREHFATCLLTALRTLVGADYCGVQFTSSRDGERRTLVDPILPADVLAAVPRYIHQNPLFGRRLLRPVAVSEILSRHAWHRTDFYGEVYGRYGQEDGLGLDIDLGSGSQMALVVTRGKRGFTTTESEMIALLGPHARNVQVRFAREEREYGRPGSKVLAALSLREREILLQAVAGARNEEIAALHGIAAGTVKRHLENAYAKLGVSGRRHAAEMLRAQPATA